MDARSHPVMRQDQRFGAHLQHRAIVVQAARGGMRDQRAQALDEGEFAVAGQLTHRLGHGIEHAVDEFGLARVEKGVRNIEIFVDHRGVATSARAISS